MKKKTIDQNRAVLAIFATLAGFFILFIVAVNYGLDRGAGDGLRTFNLGWRDGSGNEYAIEDVRVDDKGVAPVVCKELPVDVSDGDCLCFEVFNINLNVSVDGEEIYSFESKDNLTGLGYGTAFHKVGLAKSMSGKTVEIRFEKCNPLINSKRGHIENIYLGPPVQYVYMLMSRNLLTLIASGLILFFGIVFLLISFVISDNERLPFDVAALGGSSIILGAWLLVLTNVFQLISGHIYIVRCLDRFLVLLAGVPLICFFNSLTHKKNKIYPLLEFWLSILGIAFLIFLRYVVGIDMMKSFIRFLLVYFAQIIIITLVMFIRNESYCKANGIESGLKYYYVGIAAFISFALADYTLYFFMRLFGNSYGVITSIGAFILVPVVLVQFIKWWTKDRQVVERERFTNRALQYALSSDSPDESIRMMLKYMGEELKCKRVALFEDMHNGRFNCRYAWFENNIGKKSVDLIYIPYKGIVDKLINSFKENGNRFNITNVEDYKDLDANLYNVIKTYDLKTVVANPLEVDGVVTGLLLLLDMPGDLVEESSSVAALTSYFLSQLILRRDDQKRMRTYTYNDSLSGANNRRAYDEFVKERLDLSAPFGYMVCRIDNLEEISDKEGFDAGDKLIADTVMIMEQVFGKDNVYRMAGSRFDAFGFETDETYFRDDVARFEKDVHEKGIGISVGSVYCINGANDMRTVIKQANSIMRSL